MNNKIILVTGGSGDIGGAIVNKLAQSKKNIVCLQYSSNKNKALAIKANLQNVFLFKQNFFENLNIIIP